MITVYKNSFDNIGYKKQSTISDLVDLIRSEKYKLLTEELRSIADPKAAYKFKQSKFVAVTWSGSFSFRNSESLVKHSGIICLDIDKLSTEDHDRLLVNLPKDSLTHILFTSPSGNGLKLIVKIDCTDENTQIGKTHKEIFFPALVKYFSDNYSVTIDPSGSNVDRLCYIPYDSNIYFNPDSDIFYCDLTEDDFIISSRNSFATDEEFTIKNIEHCIDQLRSKRIDLTTDYNQWVRIGMAFSSMGEAGREWYHKVSSLYQSYSTEETDKKFDNFLNSASGRISIATFFFSCKDAGIELQRATVSTERANDYKKLYADIHDIHRAGRELSETDLKFLSANYFIDTTKIQQIAGKIYENTEEYGIDTKPDVFKVKYYLQKLYDFQKNEITGIVQFRAKAKGSFTTINKNTVYIRLLEDGFKFSFEKLKALLGSDFIPVVNPFEQYFNGLPEWDGVDHIEALGNYVTTDSQEFWLTMFKKALVRSIACAIGGRENRIIMVLVQEDQETGKTSFIRFLNPFGSNYYTESPLRDSKDIEFRFSENFIYNLEELSSLHAIDINKLKAMISKATIKERRAYAEYEEESPRRCNFWASTNKPEFLTDTQNTRWLCFNVTNISHDYNNIVTGVKNIDIHKVWSQAMHLYKTGFNYNLDASEKARRDETNQQYQQGSSETELIVKHLKASDDKDVYMTLADIEESLLTITKSKMRLSRYALGRALTHIGHKSHVKKINKHPTRVYFLTLTDPLTTVSSTSDSELLF